MITSGKQTSPPSLVCKQNSSHFYSALFVSGYSFQPHCLGNSFMQNFAPFHFQNGTWWWNLLFCGKTCISSKRSCENNGSDVEMMNQWWWEQQRKKIGSMSRHTNSARMVCAFILIDFFPLFSGKLHTVKFREYAPPCISPSKYKSRKPVTQKTLR